MYSLLRISGSLAYLVAAFLNAFVDVGHKIIIQNTVFKVYDDQLQVILTAIVNGLILLPFILLLSPSALVADRYPKNRVLKVSGWVALLLTLAITLCYYQGWFWIAFAMTFLLAMQSAFYSPAKYGYIRPLFGKERLAPANGLVQAISIVAILTGTLLYSLFFESLYPAGATDSGSILQAIAPLGWLLVLNAALELLALHRLPTLEQGEPGKPFPMADYLSGKLAAGNLRPVLRSRMIGVAIIGLAMFWSVGQVMLAAFPAYAKTNFGVTNTAVIQAILACTGVGIVFGCWWAGRLSRHHIETGLIPLAAVGIALCLWLLPTIDTLLGQALLFTAVGTAGGLFIVPLNALIQFHASEHQMGRMLAVNNWLQNLSMIGFLALTVLFALQGFDSRMLLQMMALVAVVGGAYTVYRLPQSLLPLLLSVMMRRCYRIRVQGLDNLPGNGGVLLQADHLSGLDWAVMQIACPRSIRFVTPESITQSGFSAQLLSYLFKRMGGLSISPKGDSSDALAQVAELLNAGELVCIFPESCLDQADKLTALYRDYEAVPVYLQGLCDQQGDPTSRLSARLNADLSVSFGEPLVGLPF